jgi:hypothetical protein
MIYEYQVIQDSDFESFVLSVDSHLKNGWEVCGGIAVTQDKNGRDYFYQAITKEMTETEATLKKLRKTPDQQHS